MNLYPAELPPKLEVLRLQAIATYQSGQTLRSEGKAVGRSRKMVKERIEAKGVKLPEGTEENLALSVLLTPELRAIPPEERKDFCLRAIANALKSGNLR
jgi:hypothetical protein